MNRNFVMMLAFFMCIGLSSSFAQCLHFPNLMEIYSLSERDAGKFLTDNGWKDGKPEAFNKFNRNMKSWSLNNANGPVCWLDYCSKSGLKNILVYQFISPTNYSEIKSDVLSAGFSQQKMKITDNDIVLAFVKNDIAFILRKHTYNHNTEGNYALLLLSAKDLDSIWSTYAK